MIVWIYFLSFGLDRTEKPFTFASIQFNYIKIKVRP